jgi:hypothetical protein
MQNTSCSINYKLVVVWYQVYLLSHSLVMPEMSTEIKFEKEIGTPYP